MHSPTDIGVMTQQMMNNSTVTNQPENIPSVQCEVGGTTSETTKVSTVMHSPTNIGVMTQQMMNNAKVTNQPENIPSVQCEVCNIMCNTVDVLEKHKKGKKHLKNLQKLGGSSVIAPIMPPPSPPPAVVTETLVKEVENKKDELSQNEGSADTSIYCDICNVVCNNEDVYRVHVSGKKHSAKAVIQLASTNGNFALTSPSQKKPETTLQCELCKICCTSNELLNMHIAGKKHLKKLKESVQLPDPSLTHIAPQVPPPTNPIEEATEGKTVNSHEGKLVWCQLCGISCTGYDVLKTHLLGKKHQKNLEKLEKKIGPNPTPGIEPTTQELVKDEGKIVNLDGSNRKTKRGGSNEDVETKKQKILQGGGTADALRTCTVCNVVCNSQTVFISHLAGQKHAAMAVKQAEAQATSQET